MHFIYFLVCLQDSVIAFHKHGVQGRSFRKGEITQEITDTSRTYKLLGSDKYVANFIFDNDHINFHFAYIAEL